MVKMKLKMRIKRELKVDKMNLKMHIKRWLSGESWSKFGV